MYDCALAQVKSSHAPPSMQRMSVIASFQKCPSDGMVRVRTGLVGRIGSRVRVGASFQKKMPVSIVGGLGSGLRLVSRMG